MRRFVKELAGYVIGMYPKDKVLVGNVNKYLDMVARGMITDLEASRLILIDEVDARARMVKR